MLEHITGLVIFAYSRAEKPEETGFANDQADGCRGYPDFGTFLHTEGHDTQRFQWPRRTWNGQAGRFDTHVVRTRRPTANANTPADLGKAVVRGPTRHGVIQIVCPGEHLWLDFLAVPLHQDVHQTIAKDGGLEDTAVEEHMRHWRGVIVRAMQAEEMCQVSGHSDVRLVGQPEL